MESSSLLSSCCGITSCMRVNCFRFAHAIEPLWQRQWLGLDVLEARARRKQMYLNHVERVFRCRQDWLYPQGRHGCTRPGFSLDAFIENMRFLEDLLEPWQPRDSAGVGLTYTYRGAFQSELSKSVSGLPLTPTEFGGPSPRWSDASQTSEYSNFPPRVLQEQ